jgi:hypothetical protein
MASVTRGVVFSENKARIVVLSLSRDALLGVVLAERVYRDLSPASYGRLKKLWHENAKNHDPSGVSVPGLFTFSRIKERSINDQT